MQQVISYIHFDMFLTDAERSIARLVRDSNK